MSPPRGSSVAERAQQHDVDTDEQDSLFDRVVENDLLAQALERREKAKGKKTQAVADFKVEDDKAKDLIAQLGVEEGEVVRISRFKVKKSVPGEPKDVSFTTTPSARVTISLLDG